MLVIWTFAHILTTTIILVQKSISYCCSCSTLLFLRIRMHLIDTNYTFEPWKWVNKEAPSVLMLCMHVFIFTSGSSALLGCPHCGLLIWLSLFARFNTFSEFMPKKYSRKKDRTRKYLKCTNIVWYKNDLWWLPRWQVCKALILRELL